MTFSIIPTRPLEKKAGRARFKFLFCFNSMRDWILLGSFAKVSSFEDASSEILKREICRIYEVLSSN